MREEDVPSDTEEEDYQRMVRAIESSVPDGQIVIKWVAVLEVLDEDGDRAVWSVANQEASSWDVLGLLDFAKVKTRARVDITTWAQFQILTEDDDDDE